MSKGLPSRNEDFSGWYNELVKKADLAENSSVRGCMVIKPYGFSVWEKCNQNLIQCLKNLVIKMHIFLFSYLNPT